MFHPYNQESGKKGHLHVHVAVQFAVTEMGQLDSGNLPIVKNGLGGKKNIFTHHVCFEK